jgi:CxxC motif-containing protein
MDKNFTCITCPIGCKLKVIVNGDKVDVTGNKCRKGIEFAKNEMFNPTRTLTTTVKTTWKSMPYLPVRTDGEIPKGLIEASMAILRDTVVKKELKVGETVVENILDTKVNVIATMNTMEEGYE